MKKLLTNRTPILLALSAVTLWAFYFLNKDNISKKIIDNQSIIDRYDDIKQGIEFDKELSNDLPIREINNSFGNYAMYFDDDKKPSLDIEKLAEEDIPTSYESDNFEGYSTVIPDYEKQIVIVKAFYFQSDTKYGTDFYKRISKYSPATNYAFKLEDSIFYSMESPRTVHVFDRVGDTTFHPYFLDKKVRELFHEYPEKYSVDFKIIPRKKQEKL